jgi:G:T-mismatch repair DNA endonuclease (very short patch repair protein)
VLESYCQGDVTVLRQACQIFRCNFLEIGNIEVFLEAVTIASASNKVFRKRFLKSDTIGLIPSGRYTNNTPQRKQALMSLAYRQQTDACSIRHGRNGREYRLPELPHLKVDGYCEHTRTVYEFNGCYWHGCPRCQILRDVPTIHEDTLAERYERTMNRVGVITQAGYKVEMQWECDFDRDILKKHPELETLPIVQHSPPNTRHVLYGGRTEAMQLHYKIKDGETIQYVDDMSLSPGCVSTSNFL